jgi:hypothetical protein
MEALIIALIYIGIVVAAILLALWALEKFGLALPPRVVQIGWVIAVLIIILILWRAFGHMLPGF